MGAEREMQVDKPAAISHDDGTHWTDPWKVSDRVFAKYSPFWNLTPGTTGIGYRMIQDTLQNLRGV